MSRSGRLTLTDPQAALLTRISDVARVSLAAGGPVSLIHAAVAAVMGTDGRGGMPRGPEPFIIHLPPTMVEREWPEEIQGGRQFACKADVLRAPPWDTLLPALHGAAVAWVNLERAASRPVSNDTWDACLGTLRKLLGFAQAMGWRRVGLAVLWDGGLAMEYASFLNSGRDVEGATIAREVAWLHRLADLSQGFLPEAERLAAPAYLVLLSTDGSTDLLTETDRFTDLNQLT